MALRIVMRLRQASLAARLRIIQGLSELHMEQLPPELIEQYVPGVAGGRHYMARVCQWPDGLWRIDVIHVESLAPVHGSDTTWATREEAAQAADKLVGAIAS